MLFWGCNIFYKRIEEFDFILKKFICKISEIKLNKIYIKYMNNVYFYSIYYKFFYQIK